MQAAPSTMTDAATCVLVLVLMGCGEPAAPTPPRPEPAMPGSDATEPPAAEAADVPAPTPEPVFTDEAAHALAEPPRPAGSKGVVRLTFVGDVAFTWRAPPAGAALAPDENPLRDVRALLEPADLTVANMEGVLVDADPRFATPTLNLWAPPVWAPTFAGAGVDLVSHANNHAFDGRSEGVFATRRAIEATGVAVMGSGRSRQEARRPFIHRTDAGCVAILPATLGVNRTPPDRAAFLALYIFEANDDLFDEVRAARRQCDAVVVYIHWGPEYREVPIPFVRRYARRLVEAGAVLVVGHHPHVLQGVEHRPGGVIIFSLGNFVFTRPRPTARLSGVLQVGLRLGGEEPVIEDYGLVPVVIGAEDYAPRPAEGRDVAAVLARMQRTSRPLGTEARLEDGVIRFRPRAR